jgi:hypothetical protein
MINDNINKLAFSKFKCDNGIDIKIPPQFSDDREGVTHLKFLTQTGAIHMILTEDVLRRYRANQGYVYLIHAVGTDRYKIGRSVNPPVRLETLKKQSPYPLQIVECFWTPDAITDEKKLHIYFKSDRVYGEWFTFKSSIELNGHKGCAAGGTIEFAEDILQTTGMPLDTIPIKWVYEIFSACNSVDDICNASNYLLSLIGVVFEMLDAGIEDTVLIKTAISASIKTFHGYTTAYKNRVGIVAFLPTRSEA